MVAKTGNSKQAPKRIRTCIACGTQQGKTSLHRLVRKPDGAIDYDPSGRAPGRGAYVCSSACLDRAFAGKRLENALKVKIAEEDKQRVAAQLRHAFEEE